VLFDMLNSFVSLARLLNLSHVSNELGFTRQTVKRHITELEDKIGASLFRLEDRKYVLTKEGEEALPGAKMLLLNANNWISGISGPHSSKIKIEYEEGANFHFIQKHPISLLHTMGPKLLKSALKSWIDANGRIDHDALKALQLYAVNFRKQEKFWVCMSIGEKSSLASWLGQDLVMSSAGALIQESPITGNYTTDAVEAYDYVYHTGDIVYDHVCSGLPHTLGGRGDIANFQRLILPCTFPNGEGFISSFVFRTNNINISNFEYENIPKMSEEWEMKDK